MGNPNFNEAPIPHRELVHRRRVECTAYSRPDGLWEVEAQIEDTKPSRCVTPERVIEPGEPIHKMVMKVVIDQTLAICDVESTTLDAPYRICGNIGSRYDELIGLRIGPGFTKAVKAKFRGVEGCTHLTELLPVIATTVFQAFVFGQAADPDSIQSASVSPFDGCHALKRDGEIVERYFLEFIKKA